MAVRTGTMSSGTIWGPKYIGITMNQNEYPSGVIQFNISSSGPYWITYGGSSGTQYQYSLWLCDSNGNNGIWLTTLKLYKDTGEYYALAPSHNLSIVAKGLVSKALYIKINEHTYNAPDPYMSGNVTVTVNTAYRPTVTAGNYINKTDMDSLKSFYTGGITVNQGDIILQSAGNSYKSGTLSGNPIVTANWYNT